MNLLFVGTFFLVLTPMKMLENEVDVNFSLVFNLTLFLFCDIIKEIKLEERRLLLVLETVQTLKEKYNLSLDGEFEREVEEDNLIFRYQSTNPIIGVVSSRPMKVSQYVASLLSFMECLAFLESTMVRWVV